MPTAPLATPARRNGPRMPAAPRFRGAWSSASAVVRFTTGSRISQVGSSGARRTRKPRGRGDECTRARRYGLDGTRWSPRPDPPASSATMVNEMLTSRSCRASRRRLPSCRRSTICGEEQAPSRHSLRSSGGRQYRRHLAETAKTPSAPYLRLHRRALASSGRNCLEVRTRPWVLIADNARPGRVHGTARRDFRFPGRIAA